MKRMRWWILSTAVALSAVAQVRAEDATMTLADGTKFSFELVRSAGKSRTELASGVATSKGVGCRLLYDSKRLRFFGYTVVATPLAGDRFRLEFGPLTPEVLERLAKDFRPEGRQLVGESLAIEYPPALEVQDDEPLMLELMVNPTTGEKLSDVIRVSRTTKSSPEPDRLVVKAAVLKVNGKALASSGGLRAGTSTSRFRNAAGPMRPSPCPSWAPFRYLSSVERRRRPGSVQFSIASATKARTGFRGPS